MSSITHNQRIAKMTFASVYPLYLTKVEKKGRTKAELHQVIAWLTGFDNKKLQGLIKENVTFETFFQRASLNPHAHLITGVICGYRVEEIEDPLTQRVRYLDKLVDELAKGRKMGENFAQLMNKQLSTLRSIVIPIAMSVTGLLSVVFLSMSLQNGTIPLWKISENKLLNFTFTMQLMALPISLVAITLLYFYKKENFKTFFRVKTQVANTASAEENNWKFLGPVVAIAFTLGTISYMSAGVISQHGQVNASFYKLLPLVILFAATNAWTEEILTRFVIVSGLYGILSKDTICWISATIFGLGHFFGTPNGIFGVLASGILGWLLAKSVVETKALGWAWFIHFLQDVVIFGAGAMILAGQR